MGVPEFLPVDVYLGCFQTGLCLVTQSCLTLCDPMHCSPAGFSSPWGFSRQEYWSELLRPLPRDLPNPGIEPKFLTLQVDSLPSEPPGEPENTGMGCHAFLQGIVPIQDSNQGLLHCRRVLYQLSHQGSPAVTEYSRSDQSHASLTAHILTFPG